MLTKTPTYSQEKNKKRSGLSISAWDNLFSKSSKSTKKVLNYLFSMGNCHKSIFPSSRHISQETGVSIRQVERITKWLQDNGIIKKIRRPYTSCIFIINSIFNNPYVREQLKHLFKAFLYLPLAVLMSSYSSASEENYKDGGVLNLFQDYINLKLYIYTSDLVNITHEYDRTMYQNQKFKKSDQKMENKKLDLIPKYIHGIESINLTPNGKIELSLFPEPAIKGALNYLKRKDFKTNKEKFFYVKRVCIDYCKRNKLSYKQERLNELREYYNIPVYGDFVEEGIKKESACVKEFSANSAKAFSAKKPPKEDVCKPTVLDYDPNADKVEWHKVIPDSRKEIEDPIIAWAKIQSCKKAFPERFKFGFLPEPPKPDVSEKEIAAAIEEYRKTPECAWFEKRFEYTIINPLTTPARIPVDPTASSRIDGNVLPAYNKTIAVTHNNLSFDIGEDDDLYP